MIRCYFQENILYEFNNSIWRKTDIKRLTTHITGCENAGKSEAVVMVLFIFEKILSVRPLKSVNVHT